MIYTVINNNIKFNIGKTTKQNIPKNISFFPKIFLNSDKRYLLIFFYIIMNIMNSITKHI